MQQNAVAIQQRKIDQAQQAFDLQAQQHTNRLKRADQLDLDLKTKEEHVAKLRANLNTAKTNKEYAAVLTEINTFKADNAKLEEEALAVMGQMEASKAEVAKAKEALAAAQARLDQIRQASAEEIERLSALESELLTKRDTLAGEVEPEALHLFDRVVGKYEGEAMAVIEIHGKKPPHTYVCGGCFMGLRAEHVNALRVRDQIRTCDNCGRILYLQEQAEKAAKG
ncbi:MAG: C4-type zinc ribbon domain-containing protein [Phycisphaerae bacterium]